MRLARELPLHLILRSISNSRGNIHFGRAHRKYERRPTVRVHDVFLTLIQGSCAHERNAVALKRAILIGLMRLN